MFVAAIALVLTTGLMNHHVVYPFGAVSLAATSPQ
jgi:hypothetical protein